MDRHLSPRYGQVILVSGYPVLTAVNWSQHWCAIYVCNISLPVLPNWLESVRIKHWFSCGADGRAGGRCTITWLPNFLGWVDLLTHGAPQARFARQSSATIFLVTKVFQKGTMFWMSLCFSLTWDSVACNGRRQGFMVAWASLSVYSRPLPSEKMAILQPGWKSCFHSYYMPISFFL